MITHKYNFLFCRCYTHVVSLITVPLWYLMCVRISLQVNYTIIEFRTFFVAGRVLESSLELKLQRRLFLLQPVSPASSASCYAIASPQLSVRWANQQDDTSECSHLDQLSDDQTSPLPVALPKLPATKRRSYSTTRWVGLSNWPSLVRIKCKQKDKTVNDVEWQQGPACKVNGCNDYGYSSVAVFHFF